MNEFEQASSVERSNLEMLSWYLGCCFVPTPAKGVACIDGFFCKNGKTLAIEAKYRGNWNHDDFDSLILEKQKYERIREEILNNDLAEEVLYAHFFKDGVVVIYNLTRGDWKWVNEEHNAASVVDKGKKIKTVGYLSYELCTIIDLKNNKVIK